LCELDPLKDWIEVRVTSKTGSGSSSESDAIFSGLDEERCFRGIQTKSEVSYGMMKHYDWCRTDLERENKVLEEGALLSLKEPYKVLDSEVRLAHRVRLPTESVLDVRLSAGPSLLAVQMDRLLKTAARKGFLYSEGPRWESVLVRRSTKR
jgi:hypothetical protein